MILRASDFSFDLPLRAAHWHALAEVIEGLPGLFHRWNLRRRTAADLRSLSRAQIADLGLEGADMDEVAERILR